MGLFSSLFSISNIDLAEKIMEYKMYQPFIDQCPDKRVREACWNCQNLKDVYKKVTDLVNDDGSAKALYLLFYANYGLGVIYNERAKYYLKKYLKTGLYKPLPNKKAHLVDLYSKLAKCYERDLEYDEAIKCYKYIIENLFDDTSIYIHIAELYKKKNDLFKACEILENARKGRKKQDKDDIDRYLTDYTKKIENNYKFKPTTRERKRIMIDKDNYYDFITGEIIN